MGCPCEDKEKGTCSSVRQAERNPAISSITSDLGLRYGRSGLTWALIGQEGDAEPLAAAGNTRTLPSN